MQSENNIDIKKQKGAFWSKPGTGRAYHETLSSRSGILQLKNRVELSIVMKNAQGRILDAGTGTGRFAIPLAQCSPDSVVALDYSREMLTVNRELSLGLGLNVSYVQGDVEHLPFPSGHFDTVISMSCVRHFPQYQAILAEYVRVLKSEGNLIFDMRSGDHVKTANRIWPRFGNQYSKLGFYDYEAEVPFCDLVTMLDSIGVDVVDRLSYDFFNNNSFLQILTLHDLGYRIVNKALRITLMLWPLQRVAAWLELGILRHLPPAFTYNYIIIGRKR